MNASGSRVGAQQRLFLPWAPVLKGGIVAGKITGLIRAPKKKKLFCQHRGEDVKFVSSCFPFFFFFNNAFGVCSQSTYKVDLVERIGMKCFSHV